MSDQFVGEIRMFAGGFAPRSWALCDGQLLSVSQNDALFSLLGTIYGGDGRTTFGLPDMRGRVPVHAGSGPGMTPRRLGQRFGQEDVTLTKDQIPQHTHQMRATSATATTAGPANTNTLATAAGGAQVYEPILRAETLKSTAVSSVGGSQKHTNLRPFQCVNFIIALYGVYPSRN